MQKTADLREMIPPQNAGGDSLQRINDFNHRIAGWQIRKDMHMVFVCLDMRYNKTVKYKF